MVADQLEKSSIQQSPSSDNALSHQSFSDGAYFSQVMQQESGRKSASAANTLPEVEISFSDSSGDRTNLLDDATTSNDYSGKGTGDSSYAKLGYRRATPDCDPMGELQQRLTVEHEHSDRTNHKDGSITHKFKDGSIIYLGADGSSTYIDPEGNAVCRNQDGTTTIGKISEKTRSSPDFTGKIANPQLEFERRVVNGADPGVKTEGPDGSISRKFKDGSSMVQGADGSMTYTDSHGNLSRTNGQG